MKKLEERLQLERENKLAQKEPKIRLKVSRKKIRSGKL
jgi:hypothetical protein